MARCFVVPLYIHGGRVGVAPAETGRLCAPMLPLPPLSLPQALLPAGARFAGAGSIGEDDAYLFVVDAPFAGQTLSLQEACQEGSGAPDPLLPALMRLALEHEAAQEFSLVWEGEGWRATSRDMAEDIY